STATGRGSACRAGWAGRRRRAPWRSGSSCAPARRGRGRRPRGARTPPWSGRAGWAQRIRPSLPQELLEPLRQLARIEVGGVGLPARRAGAEGRARGALAAGRALGGLPLLLGPLRGVAGLALLALLLLALLAGAAAPAAHARGTGHPGHTAATGHLLHHL